MDLLLTIFNIQNECRHFNLVFNLTGKMLVISDFGDQSKLHLCRVQLSIFYVNLASNVIVEGHLDLDFEVAVAESLRRC